MEGDGKMITLEDVMKMSGEDLNKACDDKLNVMEEDIDNAIKSTKEYLEVFLLLTNHVTTITTLYRDEYDEFLSDKYFFLPKLRNSISFVREDVEGGRLSFC